MLTAVRHDFQHTATGGNAARVRHRVPGAEHLDIRCFVSMGIGDNDQSFRVSGVVLLEDPRHGSGSLAGANNDRAAAGWLGQVGRQATLSRNCRKRGIKQGAKTLRRRIRQWL